MTKYPGGSTSIDENLCIDSLQGGIIKKVCLYKKDKQNNVILRSVYHLTSSREIKYIERYDVNNHLIQIFYPFGQTVPKEEVSDTVKTALFRKYIQTSRYEENEVQIIKIFSPDGLLIESTNSNVTFKDNDVELTRTFFIYNDSNNLIRKTTVDKNNRFIADEEYYYKNNVLVRYLKDENIADNIINEEQGFDEEGKITYLIWQLPFSGDSNKFKYYYSNKSLLERDEFYRNNQMVFYVNYVYKVASW